LVYEAFPDGRNHPAAGWPAHSLLFFTGVQSRVLSIVGNIFLCAAAAELTRKRLRRGVHTSVRQLEADIRSFIDRHNQNPRPFKWTKSADQILTSVKRFCHKAQQTLCAEL
jgi:hypothetical protein